MDKEFALKLKQTLDSMIAQNSALADRVSALEHSVNEVIIGGLTSAADEYEDNERFSEFVDAYSPSYSPFGDACKVIYGDDYDIAEELYSGSKDKEDVKSYVEEEIQKLQSKINALKAMKDEPTVEENTVEEEPKEFDEEELLKIAKESL